jgi:hypothetical protein
MIKWFAANNLVLNLDNKNIIKIISNHSSHSTPHVGNKEKYIEETVDTEFLGLKIVSHIKWKNHNEQVILKLSTNALHGKTTWQRNGSNRTKKLMRYTGSLANIPPYHWKISTSSTKQC